jgi:hypothetical protein
MKVWGTGGCVARDRLTREFTPNPARVNLSSRKKWKGIANCSVANSPFLECAAIVGLFGLFGRPQGQRLGAAGRYVRHELASVIHRGARKKAVLNPPGFSHANAAEAV